LGPASHAGRRPLSGWTRDQVPAKVFPGGGSIAVFVCTQIPDFAGAKKVNAGAQFFQTNLVYDIEHMEIWLNELAKRNILDKVYTMVGITPLKSLKMTHYMTEVPGVWMLDPILKRMEAADTAGNAQEEGVQIALELAHKIRGYEKQVIHGLHIMPVGWEDIVPRIVTEAGLLQPGRRGG